MGGLRFESRADMPPGLRAKYAAQQLMGGVEQKTKYHNEQVTVEKLHFDSKKEYRRYLELMTAVNAGLIYDLRLQQNFTLIEGYTKPDGERIKPMVYKADFTYRVRWPWPPTVAATTDDQEYWSQVAMKNGAGTRIIEDVKTRATRTRAYINKYKMMAELGHTVREV